MTFLYTARGTYDKTYDEDGMSWVKYIEWSKLTHLTELVSLDDKGRPHILLFATENWWISDPNAFHNQTKASLNVDCLEDSETLNISLENRENFFRKKTTAGYVASQNRILSLINYNAKERYEYLLQQYPDLVQRIPKSLIASYLGITRETLSRLTSQ